MSSAWHMDILYHRLVKEFDPQKVARIWEDED